MLIKNREKKMSRNHIFCPTLYIGFKLIFLEVKKTTMTRVKIIDTSMMDLLNLNRIVFVVIHSI